MTSTLKFAEAHLDSFLNEENRNVVSNNVPVSLVSIEFDSKASNISNSVCASSAALYGRETDKNGRGSRGVRQDAGGGNIFAAFEQLESTVGTGASSMDDTFGNSLVIESMNLIRVRTYDDDGQGALTLSRKT